MATLEAANGATTIDDYQQLPGLRELARRLGSGESSAAELTATALELAGASRSVFVSLAADAADRAREIDRARRSGQATPPLAGVPIAIKDLFNLRGEPTLAGSTALRHEAVPEAADAAVVAPLRAAGLLFIGRTNMSEFAFSGIGRNPHHGTPLSIWDRATGRLPGGSSSGSAVAVAEGIVAAALGSDTAGSCRIPAAFNGVVGVKPSFGRLSLDGIFPLSPTLDAPGPIAVDVDSCRILEQWMCGAVDPRRLPEPLAPMPAARLRLVVPDARVMDDLDAAVEAAFERALDRLRAGGARIDRRALPLLDRCDDLFVERPLVVREAWLAHRERLERHADEYDPFVATRMMAGADVDDAEQRARYRDRAQLAREFDDLFRSLGADALLYPTVACLPPPLAATEDPEAARLINLRCLRNTATVNIADGCAISLPCQRSGEAPVGLMLVAANGDDDRLYRLAATIEATLAR